MFALDLMYSSFLKKFPWIFSISEPESVLWAMRNYIAFHGVPDVGFKAPSSVKRFEQIMGFPIAFA